MKLATVLATLVLSFLAFIGAHHAGNPDPPRSLKSIAKLCKGVVHAHP